MSFRNKTASYLKISISGAATLAVIVCILAAFPVWGSEETALSSIADRFANPPSDVRPQLRWWLPEAWNTDGDVTAAVDEVADAGFGGVETLTRQTQVDATIYGWGTSAWNERMTAILKEANERGIGFSFTSGPSWQPAITGLSPDDEAASQELAYGEARIAGGQTFDAQVPAAKPAASRGGPGGAPGPSGDIPQRPTKFVAATAARVLSESTGDQMPVVLDPDSLIDLTGQVKDGNLTWTAPEDGTWIIFGFWRRGVGQEVSAAFETAYVINHFDPAGAKALADYWDENLFTPEILQLVKQNTHVDFFEDSLEIENYTGVFWSKNVLTEFAGRRGYSLEKYLPALFQFNNEMASGGPPTLPGRYDFGDETMRVRADFLQTLTELYQEYHLEVTQEWLKPYGITLRAQVSYGQRLEMSQPATTVDTPEVETLGFNDAVDVYRGMAGPAHLFGKRHVSSESAARWSQEYSQTVPSTLTQLHRGFAGGVTMHVFHGYAYRKGPGARWPGYEGMGMGVSERWGPRKPMWRDAETLTAYLGRQQLVLSEGRPRFDVAIVRLSWFEDNLMVKQIQPTIADESLWAAGYSYEAVSPMNLASTEVKQYEDGFGLPGYQAFVVQEADLILSAAKRLADLAKAGMPVVIVGELSFRSPFSSEGDTQEYQAAISTLRNAKTTRQVETRADVARALKALGVQPRARYESAAALYNVLREDDSASYLWLYNPETEPRTTEVAIAAKGTPYLLDPWTGRISPVGQYRMEDGRVIVPITVEGLDTRMIAVEKDGASSLHAVSTDADAVMGSGDDLRIRVTRAGSYRTELSDGRTITTRVSAMPSPMQLSSWHLEWEDWGPGDAYYETEKKTSGMDLDKLASWSELPGIGEDVSGVGVYTATLTMPDDWDDDMGATLDLGPVLETASVKVNGISVSPVNWNRMTVDLGKTLKAGRNTLEVTVTTTLNNRLMAMGIVGGGFSMPGSPTRVRQSYGLVGPVTLTPYREAVLK